MSDRPQNKHLKPFKPGQSGNPSGKKKGNLTKAEIEDFVSKCYRMNRSQLKDIIEDPKSEIIQIHIASIMAQGVKKGDFSSLNALLDRSVGKVKDVSEVHQHNHDSEFDKAPRGELIDILRRSNTK